jgi:hypothetical protein
MSLAYSPITQKIAIDVLDFEGSHSMSPIPTNPDFLLVDPLPFHLALDLLTSSLCAQGLLPASAKSQEIKIIVKFNETSTSCAWHSLRRDVTANHFEWFQPYPANCETYYHIYPLLDRVSDVLRATHPGFGRVSLSASGVAGDLSHHAKFALEKLTPAFTNSLMDGWSAEFRRPSTHPARLVGVCLA